MSIQKLISNAIENLRRKVNVLAVLDNPSASLNDRAEAARIVLSGDPDFWREIAKRTVRKPVLAPVAQTAKPVVVTPTLAPARPVPSTAPARVLRVELNSVVRSGDFADKLNNAATQIGLEDRSPIGLFRRALGEDGRGKEYWIRCREVTEACLIGRLVKEESDWKLLAGKMKHNLFFGGKSCEVFLAQCPKGVVKDLLLSGEDGLWNLVERIRMEEDANPTSSYRISFIIDMCMAVGREAKDLLTDCKDAVNRMKQRGFISPDHWLVKKVAAMKVVRQPVPSEKYASPEVTPTTPVDLRLDALQEKAEAVEVPAVPLVPESVPAPTEEPVPA